MPRVAKQKKAKVITRYVEIKDKSGRKKLGGYVKGKGFYKGFGRDLGTFLGKGASVLTGIKGLDKIGGKLGAWGSKMTGWGDYKITRNSLVMPDPPEIKNRGKEGAVQIRHREYIGDVVSSTSFQMQYALNINAGLEQTFPWLSSTANQFMQYEVNGMLFEYVTTSGSAIASTNNALGEVMMATNYDSVNAPFSNKQQMLNTEFSASSVPSCNVLHPIECANRQTTVNILYTRSGSPPANTDQRLYDLGLFQLATSGQQESGVTLGELYVTYDILLWKPVLGNGQDQFYHAQLTGIDNDNFFGNNLINNQASPSGESIVNVQNTFNNSVIVDNNSIYFDNPTSQKQYYEIAYTAYCATGGTFTAPSSTSANLAGYNTLLGNTEWTVSVTQTGSMTMLAYLEIEPNPNGENPAFILFSKEVIPPYATIGDLMISKINVNE